jgi:hypothetical protein
MARDVSSRRLIAAGTRLGPVPLVRTVCADVLDDLPPPGTGLVLVAAYDVPGQRNHDGVASLWSEPRQCRIVVVAAASRMVSQ